MQAACPVIGRFYWPRTDTPVRRAILGGMDGGRERRIAVGRQGPKTKRKGNLGPGIHGSRVCRLDLHLIEARFVMNEYSFVRFTHSACQMHRRQCSTMATRVSQKSFQPWQSIPIQGATRLTLDHTGLEEVLPVPAARRAWPGKLA